MKRKILFLLVVLFLQLAAAQVVVAQDDFELKTGDLLFQVGGASSFNDAIKAVTSGTERLPFSHVGVAYIEDGEAYVLEAVPFGVMKNTLESFFSHAQKYEDKPMVVVSRLKPRYTGIIDQAIESIKEMLNSRYDFVFAPDDDKYYCSEIVYESYIYKGRKLFKAKPMTFKDSTGELSPLWVKHFEMHKQPIPEGVDGTNPADMSSSRKIEVVHRYY